MTEPQQPAEAPLASNPLEGFSNALWRERELMDDVLYALGVEELVLSAGRVAWVNRAARDVAVALERLQVAELARAVAAAAVAAHLGIDEDASLSQIAEVCGEPWRTIFLQHRTHFLECSQQFQLLASSNRELIASGQRAVRETLLGIGATTHEPTTYGPDRGRSSAARATTPFVDRSL